jgi:multicomponent Na+:H+ antiporter subunit D
MPLTAACGIVGALAISGFPLTSGFTTKTMISQAASDQGLALVWFLLAAASAGVFLHAGIKFPWFVFFQRDSGLRPKDAPWNMGAAMVFFSLLCILFGVAPQLLYAYLPYPVEYQAYTAGKVVFYLQLLLFSGLAFFLLLPLMRRTETISLDTDWLWRVALFRMTVWLNGMLTALGAKLDGALTAAGRALGSRARRLFGRGAVAGRQEHGVFARAWPIGTTALWIAVLLTAYVFFYYLD